MALHNQNRCSKTFFPQTFFFHITHNAPQLILTLGCYGLEPLASGRSGSHRSGNLTSFYLHTLRFIYCQTCSNCCNSFDLTELGCTIESFWVETGPERNKKKTAFRINHVWSPLVEVSRFLHASIFDNSINYKQDEEWEYIQKFWILCPSFIMFPIL